MGLMDMIGGLFGRKDKNGGGASLPGGIQLPAGLSNLTGGGGGLLKVLLPMLAGGGALGGLGGLGGLLGKLTQGGLGAKTQSWVGTGPNESVHPDELEGALGTDTVAKIASEAGVSHEEAKSGLASMLPGLVDKLTPGGSVPGADKLGGLIKGLDVSKLLGG
jgi:uncharacterized protein YidB (DUF937 family)